MDLFLRYRLRAIAETNDPYNTTRHKHLESPVEWDIDQNIPGKQRYLKVCPLSFLPPSLDFPGRLDTPWFLANHTPTCYMVKHKFCNAKPKNCQANFVSTPSVGGLDASALALPEKGA